MSAPWKLFKNKWLGSRVLQRKSVERSGVWISMKPQPSLIWSPRDQNCLRTLVGRDVIILSFVNQRDEGKEGSMGQFEDEAQ